MKYRERVMPPARLGGTAGLHDKPNDAWSGLDLPGADVTEPSEMNRSRNAEPVNDQANGGIRREPELPEHEEVARESGPAKAEFDFPDEEADDEVQRASTLRKQGVSIARQAAMDPGDGLGL